MKSGWTPARSITAADAVSKISAEFAQVLASIGEQLNIEVWSRSQHVYPVV
jgi:hypothetical protein